MLIAQISDFHISTVDSVNDRVLRTAAHLARAVAHLNRLAPRPDVVLATGDLVERGLPEEYRRLRAILDPLELPLLATAPASGPPFPATRGQPASSCTTSSIGGRSA